MHHMHPAFMPATVLAVPIHQYCFVHDCECFITVTALMQIASLDPATHAYSFWEGVPMDAKYAFGCLFAASKTLQVRTCCCP